MYRVQSDFVDVFETFSDEDDAIQAAVEKMQEYVDQYIEEFVDIQRVSILDDVNSYCDLVEMGDIEVDIIASDIKEFYGKHVLLKREYEETKANLMSEINAHKAHIHSLINGERQEVQS